VTDSVPPHRTVPTKDQVLVPETLLKKRKSQEKAREQRAADLEKRKKVGTPSHAATILLGDDKYHYAG
jgi:hypothetical protein